MKQPKRLTMAEYVRYVEALEYIGHYLPGTPEATKAVLTVAKYGSLVASGKSIKYCKRPDCHKQFATRHGKQIYCSLECVDWAQRRWKSAWWKKHGPEWRKKYLAKISKQRRNKQVHGRQQPTQS